MHGLKCCLQTEQTQTDTTCYFCAFLRVLHNLDLLGFCIKIHRPSNLSFFLSLTHFCVYILLLFLQFNLHFQNQHLSTLKPLQNLPIFFVPHSHLILCLFLLFLFSQFKPTYASTGHIHFYVVYWKRSDNKCYGLC